ncbi:helicase associated domain-containing protein [Streptomyces sp. NPDC001966]
MVAQDGEHRTAGAVHGRRTGGLGWGGVGGYPFGRWIADQRRSYAAGTLEARRVTELEKLGMVWSDQVTAVSGGREQELVQGPPHLVQGLLEFLGVVVA